MSTENISQIAQAKYLQPSLNQMIETARVDAVFGPATEHNGTVIVPCAEVFTAIGMGRGNGPATTAQQQQEVLGEGIGAGGTTWGRPIAVVSVSVQGVKVNHVIDFTKIFLALLTTVTAILLRFLTVSKTKKAK